MEAPSSPWIIRSFSGFGSDLKFAFRMLAKNRGFSATALLTLALCVGANTAIFSMLYALVIKPLPYRDSERIVEVYNSFAKVGLLKLPSNLVQYSDFKAHAPAFEELALWQAGEFTLGDETGSSRAGGAIATEEFLRVLRVNPLMGRFFGPDNERPNADRVVVLTKTFWSSQYKSDPGIIGKSLRIDGDNYEIIGILPRQFEAFDANIRFVRPMAWNPKDVNEAARYGVTPRLYGRLKAGSTLAEALSQVAALEKAVYDTGPAGLKDFLDRSGHIIGVETVQNQRIEPVRSTLYLLQGAVLFVLLIGCVNVANLLLARSNGRQAEIGIRIALGAGRGVIARQLLIESALLTFLGGLLGLGLASLSIQVANYYITRLMPSALPFSLDGRVMGFSAILTLVMALGIGAFPVLHLLGGSLLGALHGRNRAASSGRSVRAVSSALVVIQVAFALMLLTGAALLIHSFSKAVSVDPGFDPKNVVSARIALTSSYFKEDKIRPFQAKLLDALREIPGAETSISSATPYGTGLPILAFSIRNSTLPPGSPQPGAFIVGTSPSYLKTLHIPLVEGRWFNDSDTEKSRQVYVVDQDFAKRFFPNHSAIGQNITFGNTPEQQADWPEIVGVVGTVKHNGVEESSGNPFLYYPITQFPSGQLSVLVRSGRPTAEVFALIRDKVRSIDPALPVFQTNTLENMISDKLESRRAIMLLLLSFAASALLLAAVGIYGVLAYDVSQRMREIGIRGAVGASREQIVNLILRQGLWKTAFGLVIGIIGALLLGHFVSGLLYGVRTTDPLAYASVSVLLFGIGSLASYLPALKAARVDPVIALRSE